MSTPFNGLGMGLDNLSRLSPAVTRSINAENPRGEKGGGGMATEGEGADAAQELGRGWKISPCLRIPMKQTVSLADIVGPGAIQHIWITVDPIFWRQLILRFYWDDEQEPSIEVPLGDFFCSGWGVRGKVNSLPVAVNPAGGFNCYWEMPFRQRARISLENLSPQDIFGFFFQIDYTQTAVTDDQAYFHAQWRRSKPVKPLEVHTLLDGIRGQGQYVGTYMAIEVHEPGWWGEGEIKFYLDGDTDWPTICGTGTEDYFGGAWGFVSNGKYEGYSTSFLGLPQILQPDEKQPDFQRFGLYRWHVMDPIRFQKDLRVTLQDLGYHLNQEGKARYHCRQDDIATTAFWYQTEPHAPFPGPSDLQGLETE